MRLHVAKHDFQVQEDSADVLCVESTPFVLCDCCVVHQRRVEQLRNTANKEVCNTAKDVCVKKCAEGNALTVSFFFRCAAWPPHVDFDIMRASFGRNIAETVAICSARMQRTCETETAATHRAAFARSRPGATLPSSNEATPAKRTSLFSEMEV